MFHLNFKLKKAPLYLIIGMMLISMHLNGQTYVQPTSGSSVSQTVNCGGTYNYYDEGGSGSNYFSSTSNSIITFNPSAGGQFIQIDFTAGPFDIEPNGGGCYDWIKIYDGTNTGAPLIGTYCNSNVPGIITSTTGSLTVEFYADGSVTGTGWVATVSCYSPCSTVPGTSSASPSAFCPAGSGNTTLTLTGEDPSATIQWQVSTNGGATWSNIPGATTDPWVQPVSTNSMYHALVTNGCTSTSTSVSVTVGCPPIIQPTSGTTSTTISCGGSYNYYDSGNSGSNYSNGENGLITICPQTAGQYVSINFSSFNVENNYDYMYVFDGGDGSAQLLGIYTGALSGTVTASAANTSGCLSFRFTSDGATTNAGWTGVVSCTGTPGGPYAAPGVEDCTGGVVVCNDGNLNGGTTGPGLQELPGTWNSCLNFGGNGEIQSNWYIFSPQTSGTIGFLISPNPAADYDWTIWGPYNSLQCPAFTNDPPLRCSAASLATSGPNGETGLAAPAVDVVEASGGDGYLMPLTVNAGEVYVMMLDNWDGNNNPFTLSWQLSNGATLDCTPALPVTLAAFEAQCDKNHTLLTWTTETEINNNFFMIEKSGPDFNFKEIGKVFGAGNSNVAHHYSFTDPEVNSQTAYYRIVQVDYDGSVEYHRIVASNCHNYSFNVVTNQLTNNSLKLLITSSTNENLSVSLYNSTGKLITKETREINNGNNNITLNNFNISSGIYLVSIIGEFHSYTQKLMAK